MDYLLVKWVHVLSATLLFGTGLGSAFYMYFVNRSGDVRAISVVAGYVVLADWIFTVPTIFIQPLSGWYMASRLALPVSTFWIGWSIGLYIFAGVCWLPVVWLQIRMRDIARVAVAQGAAALPDIYWRYARVWTALGVPAFTAMVVVYYLMVAKPM